jgi:hypothetical protein
MQSRMIRSARSMIPPLASRPSDSALARWYEMSPLAPSTAIGRIAMWEPSSEAKYHATPPNSSASPSRRRLRADSTSWRPWRVRRRGDRAKPPAPRGEDRTTGSRLRWPPRRRRRRRARRWSGDPVTDGSCEGASQWDRPHGRPRCGDVRRTFLECTERSRTLPGIDRNGAGQRPFQSSSHGSRRDCTTAPLTASTNTRPRSRGGSSAE